MNNFVDIDIDFFCCIQLIGRKNKSFLAEKRKELFCIYNKGKNLYIEKYPEDVALIGSASQK